MRVKEICHSITDGSHNPPQGVEMSKYLMLSSKNIFDDEITLDDPRFLAEDAFRQEDKRTRIVPGDVLLTIVGTVGRTAVVSDKMPRFTLQRSVAVLHPKEDVCLSRYLMYALRSKRTYIEKTAKGVAQKGIYLGEVGEIDLPVPSITQQETIIGILDKVSEVIQSRLRQLRALDTLIKARFIEMFGAITETVTLSFYIESLTAGKSLAGEEECLNKVLKTGAATYDYFDPSQVKNLPIGYEPLPEHQIHNGDVIISRMNTTELVGAAAYVWQAPERTYLPDRLWKAELTDRADPIFVWQAIVQPKTKEAIRRIAGGTSGSMKNISKPGLLSLHVKKVELEQQKQFAAFVAHVDKSKVVVQRALDKAQLLFEGLMQQYFG